MHEVMRHVVLGCASVVAFCSIASADPLTVAPGDIAPRDSAAPGASLDATSTTAAEHTPATYVQAGTAVGLVSGYMTFGGSAELGRQISPHVRLHATVTGSALERLFARGTGALTQATGGFDYVRCNTDGVFCAFVGADVGMRSIQYSGMDVPLFCGDGDCGPGTVVEDHRISPVAASRVGWELGGKHVRFRTALEAAVSPQGAKGAVITDSLVFRF